ncbi:MAG: hypothetical protein H6774_02140 [Pseudomonadales bacterium]|nr:hypothetical protein [Candidatus Woesebacteria bacterium]MCB9801867.1 hypothetical protein [Pseudomonadales bacterium]
MVLYSLLIGLPALVTTGAISAVTGGLKVGRSIAAFILGALLELLALYTLMPHFAHWSSGGVFISGLIVFLSALVATLLAEMMGGDTDRFGNHKFSADGSVLTIAIGFVLFIVWIVTASCAVRPASLGNNSEWDEIAALLEPREATQSDLEASASDDDLIKISPAAANLEAQGVMPGDVGSYAQVGKTFEQTINGDQYYITDLRVTNWRGFRQAGGVLPGYFIRPAKVMDATTTFVPGHALRFVPDARWSEDLGRHVYLNFTLDCGCEVENLDVLEIDNEGNPFYTGTVWRYSVGNVGMIADAVIVVDPTDGTITEYQIGQVPDWIDRIYSLEKMQERVEWWATYSEWDASTFPSPSTTLGKMLLDSAEDVYGHTGRLFYQYTVTSSGADQTLKWEIQVDPRTGEAVKFPASGKTIQAVKDLITQQKDDLNLFVTTDVVECERQPLLGVETYYCLLQAEDSGAISGYVFVQERFTSSPSQVIIAGSFDEAWNLFRRQLTQGSGGNANVQGETADTIVVVGTVQRISLESIDDAILMLVIAEDGQALYFRVSAENPYASLTREGDKVEIVAFDILTDEANEAVDLRNESLPPAVLNP